MRSGFKVRNAGTEILYESHPTRHHTCDLFVIDPSEPVNLSFGEYILQLILKRPFLAFQSLHTLPIGKVILVTLTIEMQSVNLLTQPMDLILRSFQVRPS